MCKTLKTGRGIILDGWLTQFNLIWQQTLTINKQSTIWLHVWFSLDLLARQENARAYEKVMKASKILRMNKFSFFLCLWLRLCYACENGGKAICFSWPVILVPGSGSLWQKTFDGRGIKLRWKVRRASTKCCTTNIVAISRTETKMPTRVMSWPQKGFVFISFGIASLALSTPSNNSAWGLFLEKNENFKKNMVW